MDLITYALLSKKIASSTTGIADAVLENGILTITSTDGASYNIELPTTDATLAQNGAPADAKAVGDAIAALGQSLASLEIDDIQGLASALTGKASTEQLASLSAALANKANSTTVVAMQSAISNLQQALAELGATTALDAYPTPNSRNAVRSDGIVAYVDDLLDPIDALIAGESFELANGTIMTAPDQSAYAAAVEGGFSGTRAQFNQLMAEGLGHTGIAVAPSTDNPDIVVLIDDQSGTTIEIPEIDDENESEHDTWSSTKIATEIANATTSTPNWLAEENEDGYIANKPGSPTTVLGVRESVTTEVYDYTHIVDHINGTISATVAEVTSPEAEKVRVTINGHKYLAEFIKSQSGYTYYGYNHNSSWGLVDDTDIGIQVFFSDDGTDNEVNVSVSENCTIDWVNAIEDTSDVTISIEMLDMMPGYVPAADWEENDPSKPTYIANKPNIAALSGGGDEVVVHAVGTMAPDMNSDDELNITLTSIDKTYEEIKELYESGKTNIRAEFKVTSPLLGDSIYIYRSNKFLINDYNIQFGFIDDMFALYSHYNIMLLIRLTSDNTDATGWYVNLRAGESEDFIVHVTAAYVDDGSEDGVLQITDTDKTYNEIVEAHHSGNKFVKCVLTVNTDLQKTLYSVSVTDASSLGATANISFVFLDLGHYPGLDNVCAYYIVKINSNQSNQISAFAFNVADMDMG